MITSQHRKLFYFWCSNFFSVVAISYILVRIHHQQSGVSHLGGVWLCRRLTGHAKANILPVIITNHTVTIAAELVSLLCLNRDSADMEALPNRKTAPGLLDSARYHIP